MRRARRSILLAAAAGLALLAARAEAWGRMTSGGANILRDSVAPGGGLRAAGLLAMNTNIGEVGASQFSGGAVRLQPGLMNDAAQPGSITALTAVTKDTGTLELSWTAPGADGFQGNVVNGYYRVDYSTDPLHVFSPTTFQLELSTTVAAGSVQSLRIQGLLPNTTYYTKIYLADARKYFAEDSRRSDESTLAGTPINPAFTEVTTDTVIISWLLPSGGAESFETDGSSTNFGAFEPGGIVSSTATPNGLLVSLSLSGLNPGTTYYFKVASLNWQGNKNFTTVLAAMTVPLGPPPSIYGLAAAENPGGRSVTLTWLNPSFWARQGVLVLFSTSPATNQVHDGTTFTPGQVLADASIVRSTATATSFVDSGLALDTTYFYQVFTQGYTQDYSVSVSTSVFLDLPPMGPAGLSARVSPDRSQVTLNWQPVVSNGDGSPFAVSTAPKNYELQEYAISRATSVAYPNWVSVATVPVTALSYAEPLPDPNQEFIYRVSAVDSQMNSGPSMAVDTLQNLYALAPDQVSRYKLSASVAQTLQPGSNPTGSYLVLRASAQPVDVSEKEFNSVRFDLVKMPGGDIVPPAQVSLPGSEVTLKYDTAGGVIVPSQAGATVSDLSAAAAASNLGMYWDNGEKFVKLFGQVDPLAQEVSVQTSMLGTYQVRGLLRTGGFSFDISQISNRAITPNGDGLNDKVVFTFDNPKDSAFSGEIFDITGAKVADMAAGPLPYNLQWDGKGNGRTVASGVYVYQIRAENKVFSGTVVVIR